MSRLSDRLKTDLKTSKEYRHGYADEFLNEYIATQIKVLREQREWTQETLAVRSGMKQPRIAVLENVNHSAWKISTLRRIAEAFDLTLCVSFEEFGTRLNDFDRFSREALERWSFEEDPVFAHAEEEAATVAKNIPAALLGATKQGEQGYSLLQDEQIQLATAAESRASSTQSNVISLAEYRKKALGRASEQNAKKTPEPEQSSAGVSAGLIAVSLAAGC